MKTHTLKVTIPSEQEIVSGLALHTLHPKLTAAEEKHAESMGRLDAARAELAQRERDVDGLPARIASGHAAPGDLDRAMLQRDAAALRLGPLELAEAEALDRVQLETGRAQDARKAAIEQRRALLAKAAEQIAPLLDTLREAEGALARALEPDMYHLNLTWPEPLHVELDALNANERAAGMAWEEARRAARANVEGNRSCP